MSIIRDIKYNIYSILTKYCFEPSDHVLRSKVYQDVVEMLDNSDISSYKIKCNSENNTPDIVESGDLVVDVELLLKGQKHPLCFRVSLQGHDDDTEWVLKHIDDRWVGFRLQQDDTIRLTFNIGDDMILTKEEARNEWARLVRKGFAQI